MCVNFTMWFKNHVFCRSNPSDLCTHHTLDQNSNQHHQKNNRNHNPLQDCFYGLDQRRNQHHNRNPNLNHTHLHPNSHVQHILAQAEHMLAQVDSMLAQAEHMLAQVDSMLAQVDSMLAKVDSMLAQVEHMLALVVDKSGTRKAWT